MEQAEALARRLKELVHKNGGNKHVSAVSGVPLSTLNTYLAGTEPKLLVAAKLAKHFNVSIEALLTESRGVQELEYRGEAIQVPLREVYASAGPGAEAVDEAPSRFLSFDPLFVEQWGIAPERVEALTARGDSMLPTIQDGAVVLIDRGDRKLREKVIFAFRTPDGVRFKRFQRTVDGGALLVSDNQELYAPERVAPVDLEQFRIAGRAFWTGRMI